MDGVRDVVGGVHHRRLDGLLPVGDPPDERRRGPAAGRRARCGTRRTSPSRCPGRPAGRRRPAAAGRRCRGCGSRVVQPGPRVLQHRRPDGGGQVETGGGGAPDLGAGDDPVRLGVALEAVGQPEPLPGQPVQHPLPQVPERRVAEVVGEGGGLHHVRVAAAQLVQQVAAGSSAVSRSAIARATWATLRLWVSRLCTSSPEPTGLITWVTPPSRAKNGEATIRSRSARNGLAARSPRARALPPKSRRARGSAGGSMIATLAQRPDRPRRLAPVTDRPPAWRSGARRTGRPAGGARTAGWRRVGGGRQNAPGNPKRRRINIVTQSVHQRIADELGVRERQVTGGRRAARRRRDRAVHRPLPQGGHRRCSTTPSCARSRSGCATCASWRSAGPRSWSRSAARASSTTRWRRRSWRPTPRPGWRTSTCPYKPKRRTKAQIAREAGLEPLADALLGRPGAGPARPPPPASSTPSKGVADAAAALDGARAILVERFAEDADLIGDAARADVVAGPAGRPGCARARRRPARSSPTTSTSPSRSPKLPSHRDPGAVPRREGGGARPRPGARGPGEPTRPTGPTATRRRIAGRFGVADQGRPGRPVAGRHGALGLAHPDPGPPRHRPADAAVAGGRGRGRPGLRRQPARPAARRPGRHPRHAWAWTRACAPA